MAIPTRFKLLGGLTGATLAFYAYMTIVSPWRSAKESRDRVELENKREAPLRAARAREQAITVALQQKQDEEDRAAGRPTSAERAKIAEDAAKSAALTEKIYQERRQQFADSYDKTLLKKGLGAVVSVSGSTLEITGSFCSPLYLAATLASVDARSARTAGFKSVKCTRPDGDSWMKDLPDPDQ